MSFPLTKIAQCILVIVFTWNMVAFCTFVARFSDFLKPLFWSACFCPCQFCSLACTLNLIVVHRHLWRQCPWQGIFQMPFITSCFLQKVVFSELFWILCHKLACFSNSHSKCLLNHNVLIIVLILSTCRCILIHHHDGTVL